MPGNAEIFELYKKDYFGANVNFIIININGVFRQALICSEYCVELYYCILCFHKANKNYLSTNFLIRLL